MSGYLSNSCVPLVVFLATVCVGCANWKEGVAMLAPWKWTMRGTHTRQFLQGLVFLALLTAVLLEAGCGAFRTRKGGDFYTSDLINARIAVGPVAEARESSRDGLYNRRIALTAGDSRRYFSASGHARSGVWPSLRSSPKTPLHSRRTHQAIAGYLADVWG